MAGKSTDAEYEKRVSEVEACLLVGDTRHQILRYASKWNVSSRAVDAYIADASKNIQEVNRATLAENRAQVLRCLWEVYKEARSALDAKAQLGALKQIAAITGLEELTVRHVVDELPDVEFSGVLSELDARRSETIN